MSLFRGLPRTVWAATAFFGAMLVLWSITLPAYRSADEANHISAGVSLAEHGSWPGYRELQRLESIDRTEADGYQDIVAGEYPSLAAADAIERPDRVAFRDLGTGYSSNINSAGQHPPGYYLGLAALHLALPADVAFDLEIWMFRLATLVLLVPLPLLAAAAARRLGLDRAVQATAAIAVGAIPQLAALGGAVNSDNLLNAASAWVLLGAVVMTTGDLRLRVAALTGLAAGVALFAKAWAIPIVATAAIAILFATRGRRIPLRRRFAALAVFAATAMTGGWWWVRNLIVYGTVQPAGHRPELEQPLPVGEAVSLVARQFAAVFPERFWALLSIKFGARPFPTWLPATLTVLLVIAIVAALVLGPRLGARRGSLVLLVTPIALTMGMLVVSVVRLTAANGAPGGVQGRYLYSAAIAIAVLAAVGISAILPDRVRRAVPAAAAVFAVAFSAVAFARALSYHYGEQRWSAWWTTLPDLLAWAPVPPAITIAALAAASAASVAVMVLAVADALRRPADITSGRGRPEPSEPRSRPTRTP